MKATETAPPRKRTFSLELDEDEFELLTALVDFPQLGCQPEPLDDRLVNLFGDVRRVAREVGVTLRYARDLGFKDYTSVEGNK